MNFDRIVIDAVKRQEQIRQNELDDEKQLAFKNSTYGKLIEITKTHTSKWVDQITENVLFAKGQQWGPVGTTLRIKVPTMEPKPSRFRRVMSALKLKIISKHTCHLTEPVLSEDHKAGWMYPCLEIAPGRNW